MNTLRNVVFLFLLTIVCEAQAVEQKADETIGAPINKGFFFYDFKFVPAPYVVKRVDFKIYVNDKLVRTSPSPREPVPAVQVDPGIPGPTDELFGDPPPGKDASDNFYDHKWNYLNSKMDFKEAVKEMFNIYKLAPNVESIKWHDRVPDDMVVKLKNGQERVIGHESQRKTDSKEKLLEMAEAARLKFEKQLEGDSFLSVTAGGMEHSASAKNAREMMKVLLSSDSDEDKWKSLIAKGLVREQSPEMKKYIQKFADTDALLSRVNGRP